MPFIRVNDSKEKVQVDLNIQHIIAFQQHNNGSFKGSVISLINGANIFVTDEVKQLRGYIKKAEGSLPEKAVVSVGIHDLSEEAVAQAMAGARLG